MSIYVLLFRQFLLLTQFPYALIIVIVSIDIEYRCYTMYVYVQQMIHMKLWQRTGEV